MKKLFAFLMACTAMTCAFGSCGEKKEASSVSESSSVAEVTASETESESTSEGNTEQIETVTQPETHEYLEDADKTSFVGKWECSKLVANGEEIEELQGIPAYAVFQYDILEDGNVALPDFLTEAGDTENQTTYKWGIISETEIEITGSNGSAVVYKLENGQLTNIDNTEEIYLDKVDEFQEFDFQAYYDEIMAEQENGGYILTPVETDANGDVVSRGEPITLE